MIVLAVAPAAGCSDDSDSETTTLTESVAGSTTTVGIDDTAPPAATDAPTTIAPSAPTSAAMAPTTTGVVPQGFQSIAATATAADGTVCEMCLWLADDADLRARGLMFVTDLGGAQGMLFRYPGPTTGSFWMKNTVMPLSIAFFGADGQFLDSFDMQPCTADPCPSYPTPDDFVMAIEAPQGELGSLAIGPGSTLHVGDLPCGGV